jgi:hypothetical protein
LENGDTIELQFSCVCAQAHYGQPIMMVAIDSDMIQYLTYRPHDELFISGTRFDPPLEGFVQ